MWLNGVGWVLGQEIRVKERGGSKEKVRIDCLMNACSKGQSRPSSGTLGDTLDTMTQQMEKMNMAHLDVQVELVETRRASEQDAKVHKDHTESVRC